MPPKIKVTKDDIINAAIAIVQKNGEQALNARNIASAISCSTQPIFSNFETMDELRIEVVKKADSIYNRYVNQEINTGNFPVYKASGMAYIRFAKEEKELFKLLFMRDRTNENFLQPSDFNTDIENIVHQNTGLVGDEMRLFHLEMWAYVHGIASMFATGFFDLDWELVSKMLTDSYQGLKKQYGKE